MTTYTQCDFCKRFQSGLSGGWRRIVDDDGSGPHICRQCIALIPRVDLKDGSVKSVVTSTDTVLVASYLVPDTYVTGMDSRTGTWRMFRIPPDRRIPDWLEVGRDDTPILNGFPEDLPSDSAVSA